MLPAFHHHGNGLCYTRIIPSLWTTPESSPHNVYVQTKRVAWPVWVKQPLNLFCDNAAHLVLCDQVAILHLVTPPDVRACGNRTPQHIVVSGVHGNGMVAVIAATRTTTPDADQRRWHVRNQYVTVSPAIREARCGASALLAGRGLSPLLIERIVNELLAPEGGRVTISSW